MIKKGNELISGDRFRVTYIITGDRDDAQSRADDICYEQTVEFPDSLVPDGMIRDHVLGRIESFDQHGKNQFIAVISFAVETAASELTQLLNVLFGNISIKPGIKILRIDLPDTILKCFRGPRFGREGFRQYLKIKQRPILCTALKPMGSSSAELADMAYKFALGGIDLIKDDHGLTDQPYSPFEERVKLVSDSVIRANSETGGSSRYIANITAGCDKIFERARFAKDAGAGGLMLSPGITGFDVMRKIADDDSIGLPLLTHPAFQGSYVLSSEFGISHYLLFGQLARLAGADATIYPNYGGRFSFTSDECRSIVNGTGDVMGSLKKIFPCPGGGINMDRIPELLEFYGIDVMFLVGAGLISMGKDIVENCRYFLRLVS